VENQQAMNAGGDLSGERDLVAFRLAGQAYALPIEPIVRIIEMVKITPIPQVSSVVEGIINLHGLPVPVINLRRHFGLPQVPWGLRTPIILVQIGEQTFGLIVDEVIDVLSLSADQLSRVADILPGVMSEEPIIRGVAHLQGDTVLLLDVEYLLSPTHMQTLLQVVAELPESVVEQATEGTEGTPVVPEGSPSEVVLEEASEGGGEGRPTMLVDGFEQGAVS
jgi:purine-binding chemotaxis protein CheW